MATRAIWNGNISFGLVEIPVSLHSALAAEEEIDFDLLDRRDLSPIGYRKYNKRTGKEVPATELVRGVEVAKGKYVTFTDAEIAATDPEATRTVEVVAFVDPGEIEPVYFDRPYYLQPQQKPTKAYALLRDVLERTGKVGIARIVLRSRQHIAALIVHGPILALTLLRYAKQLRDPAAFVRPPAGAAGSAPTPAEVKLAERLVQELSAEWQPEQYHDEFRAQLLAAVRQKAKSGATAAVAEAKPPAEKGGKIIDLMALLKQSVERPGAASAPRRPRRAAKRRSTLRKSG